MSATPVSSCPRAFSRRRLLGITAAAAGLPLAAYGLSLLGPRGQFETWRGSALGAEANLSLWHPDPKASRAMIAASLNELARLERIFSLFDEDSELARLNRDGALAAPSADLVAVLEESRRLGQLSGGAFDITVQPLWTLYERHFAAQPGSETGPDERALDAARALIDYAALELGKRRAAFTRPGMAATLNGIAQGYITDRVADMLRDAGFGHVVVELGEIRALGGHPDGRPWRIGIKDPADPSQIARMIEIADAAVAVSGGYGTRFGSGGKQHHIFDPATGLSAARYLDVTVVGPRATAADGLSTALSVLDEMQGVLVLAAYPGSRAELTRRDGRVVTLSA